MTRLQATVRRHRDRRRLLLALYDEGASLPLPGTKLGAPGWYECYSAEEGGRSLYFRCEVDAVNGGWSTTAGPFGLEAYRAFVRREEEGKGA